MAFVDILGSKMHYTESGSGHPILFLHTVPLSSYCWRNIMPALTSLGRCIAVDLIGFGQSDKPDITYSVTDHIRYIEKFIETLNLKHITLVMHGFGSVIGFDYAMRHEKNCAGLIFYEAFLDTNDLSLPYLEQLALLAQYDNLGDWVTIAINQMVLKTLPAKEMDAYKQPFLTQGADKPILQYLDELPKGDHKSAIDKLMINYTKKLMHSTLPKLMLYSFPGFITTIATAMWAKENLPNIELIDIGEELHIGQESCPDIMGESISVWMQGVEQANVK